MILGWHLLDSEITQSINFQLKCQSRFQMTIDSVLFKLPKYMIGLCSVSIKFHESV